MYFALLTVFGLIVAAGNIAFWWYVVRKGDARFRAWVTRRFDVVISTGLKGHWRVRGEGSKLRLLAIEMLQLAYFMTAFFVWAVLLLLLIGVANLVEAAGDHHGKNARDPASNVSDSP